MKRMLPLFSTLATAALLSVVVAGSALAQGGINLSWSDCGTFGTLSRSFACTTNGTVGTMYASVITGVQMDQLNGEESEIIIQTNQASLSQWWHMETGGCRVNSLAASLDFTSNVNCLDPWLGQAFGGLDYQAGYGSPNRARLRTAGAIAGSTSISNTDEYYVYKITVLGGKSTGVGSCAGCTDGACFLYTQQKLTQPLGVGDYVFTVPITRQFVLFQPGGNLSGQCFNNDPVQNRTWGSVKSLYR